MAADLNSHICSLYIEDDEFRSDTGNNRLAYTAPALTDLFAGNTIQDFLDLDQVTMVASISTMASRNSKEDPTAEPFVEDLTCPGDERHCRVYYHKNWTPEIEWMVPSTVYPGMVASVGLQGKNARNYPQPGQEPVEIRIDDVRVDLSALYDEFSTLASTYEFVTGEVKTAKRNN